MAHRSRDERIAGVVGALGPRRTIPERVALFAAAAAVGPSFEPGLQPRRTIHQAVATGVISASTLSLVTATQSGIESLSRLALRDRADSSESANAAARLLLAVGANAAIAGALLGGARIIPAREDERFRRGLARVVAERTGRVAAAGAVLTGVAGAMSLVASSSARLRWVDDIPIALPAGVAASAWEVHRVHRQAQDAGDTTIAEVSTSNSVLISIGVGAGVLGLQAGERAVAGAVARAISKVAPSYDAVSNPVGHLVSLGLLGGALFAGYEYAVRRVEQGGAAIEPAYQEPPTSHLVSGGPGSAVPFATLSREGRRFTKMALSGSQIAQVMGVPAAAEPIRLFVGLDSAAVLEDRVDLVMDELVRTRAFERRVLCLASPTGSGYINYVLAESLEYLTLGDCAIATMQYSMLPSSMSLTRTGLAIEQNRALMHAVTGYLRGLPEHRRPRLVLFGESLGALTMQDMWRHRNVEAMDRDFVHSSLFLGTPSATEFAKAWRLNPAKVDPQGNVIEVDNFGEYLALDDEQRDRVRHLLVSHYDDPIPKFGTNLLLRQPWWLGPPGTRPPRVPQSSAWRPGTTFVLTAVDLINAMDVVPGQFGRRGHDYREDIARFAAAAYDLPVTAEQLTRIEHALRQRELQWAQRRVVSEQVARAREAVVREMRTWGVSGSADAPGSLDLNRLLAISGMDVPGPVPPRG
ncbi:MAG: alpha/beta-hydrolase family protein [Actinomycetales bacterium]|nr:alpha/beta-hydrolase family protein [Actinomycetales bacterium]